MKKLIILSVIFFSSLSSANYSSCRAIYQENVIGNTTKSFDIIKIKKISDNHYDLKLKVNGTIRQKLDNFPTRKNHRLIDIKCLDKENERQLKELLKL